MTERIFIDPGDSDGESWEAQHEWDWDNEELITEIPARDPNVELKSWHEQGVRMDDPEELGWAGGAKKYGGQEE